MADKMSEADRQALEDAIFEALEGTHVEVTMGPIFGDTSMRPLTKNGVQNVIDKLRARDLLIARE